MIFCHNTALCSIEDGCAQPVFPVLSHIPRAAGQAVTALQEHVDLLRALALAFPAQYPDLHALTDTDAELDFFNNVAHLQLHRRSRAFKRLGNVSAHPLSLCLPQLTSRLTPESCDGSLAITFSWLSNTAEVTSAYAGLSEWAGRQQHAHGHCSAPAAAGHSRRCADFLSLPIPTSLCWRTSLQLDLEGFKRATLRHLSTPLDGEALPAAC